MQKYQDYQHCWNDYEENVKDKLLELDYIKKGKDLRNKHVKGAINKSFV